MTRLVEAYSLLSYAFPIATFLCFFSILIAQALASSRQDNVAAWNNNDDPLGSGGRKLLKRVKIALYNQMSTSFSKNSIITFIVLSAAICLTSLANAVNVVLHAVVHQNENWWCGKPATVSTIKDFCQPHN